MGITVLITLFSIFILPEIKTLRHTSNAIDAVDYKIATHVGLQKKVS